MKRMEGMMKWVGCVVAICATSLAFESVGQIQGYGPEFLAAYDSEKDFGQIALDVRRALTGMQNKGSAEYACVDSAFRGADKLNTIFSHYKFGVAIWYIVQDEFEKIKVATILKLQTTQTQDEIRIVRERIAGSLGICSKFPLAIAKGTELLGALKKADGVVGMIGGRLGKTL